MEAISGVIEQVSAKPFNDRRTGQPINLYSFKVGGKWYRTGQKAIPFGNGQNVKFVADGQNVDVTTIQATQSTVSTAPVVVPPARNFGKSTTGGAKDAYWEGKEARDLEREARYQAVNEPRMAMSVAVEAASRAVVAAIQTDALSFGNAAKGKRLGMISDYIKELATDLAFFIQNAPETMKNKELDAAYRGTSDDVVEGEQG